MPTMIIKPAAATRLTTLENVRIDLGGKLGSPTDQQITRFIDQASARVASFCNRTFGRQIYRERIALDRGDSFMEIVLSEGPVTAITSVSRGSTVLDPAEYEHDDLRLYRVESGHRCCWCGRGLAVEYQAGWRLPGEVVGADFGDAPALPADIEKAVIQLVGVAASEAGRDPTVKSESVEGIGDRSYYIQGSAASLPHPAAEAALERYRNLVLV